MSESIDCQKLQADIDELRREQDVLRERINEIEEEGFSGVGGASLRHSVKMIDETVERILEENKDAFYERLLPNAEDAEMVDPPIEVKKNNSYIALEDDRAIVLIGDEVYHCRRRETGEWKKNPIRVTDGRIRYIRIDNEYFILGTEFDGKTNAVLYRDGGSELESIGASDIASVYGEKGWTNMEDGSVVYIDQGELRRDVLVDRAKGDDHPNRWQSQAIYKFDDSEQLEAFDKHGCFVIKKNDERYLYCIDETGKVSRSLLKDPHEGTKDEIKEIFGVKFVASDTLMVYVKTSSEDDKLYSYRIKNNEASYLCEVQVDVSLSNLHPLDDEGHFVTCDGDSICQYSPDPDRDGDFIEHPVIAPDGEQLLPRPFYQYYEDDPYEDDPYFYDSSYYYEGDRDYYVDNHYFLWNRDEGWKVIQMPGTNERSLDQLKRQLVKIADKAEEES